MSIFSDLFDATLPGLIGTGIDVIGDRVFGEGNYGWNPRPTLPQGPAALRNPVGAPTPRVPATVPPQRPTVIPGTGGRMTSNCGPETQKQVVTYDCATGAVLKVSPYRRRRRRARIATASDIADLEALKGILGKGQALSSYLAIYGRK